MIPVDLVIVGCGIWEAEFLFLVLFGYAPSLAYFAYLCGLVGMVILLIANFYYYNTAKVLLTKGAGNMPALERREVSEDPVG